MQLIHGTERGRTVVSATTAAIVEGDRGLPALRRRAEAADDEAVTVFELALD